MSFSASLFSAETFGEAARAVAAAWEQEEEVEEGREGRGGAEAEGGKTSSVVWRWAPSPSRFADALGGGYLEACSRDRRDGSLVAGVLLPLVAGGGEEEEEDETPEDEGGEDDEATLPRRRGGDRPSPSLRVELHVCFGASYRAPLMLARGGTAATAAANSPLLSYSTLETLERSLASAAAAANSPSAAGPLAPCEHPHLSGQGGWAALHACASAEAVAEMMMMEEEGGKGGGGGGGEEEEKQEANRNCSSSLPSPASSLAAWMSLACPVVGVRPPLGLWRRVKKAVEENV